MVLRGRSIAARVDAAASFSTAGESAARAPDNRTTQTMKHAAKADWGRQSQAGAERSHE